MNTLRFMKLGRALLAAVLALVPTLTHAQAGIGDVVYSVGTTARDTHGRDWAYLLWQATQPALLSNRVFAVYAKPGEATNNAPYERKSVVMLQTDARVIEPLLRRAENLGDNMVQLQSDLLQLFGNLVPSNAISRAEQLSAIIRGSLNDSQQYQNLLLLARNHAGINLALGFADAQLIPPGRTTFEIRAFDATKDQDLAVIGRITVEAGSPTVLPQPGSPVLVPETSAMGDLNIKLRWASPDDLRRLGLMQFGFNVYRLPRAFATANGWSAATPPPLNQLTNLARVQSNIVKRINRVPITPPRQFSLAEAPDLTADPKTMFIMDDDGRGRPGYVNHGFTNGAQYFYYVTARDVLGRDGRVSLGLLATVCDRMPPLPPRSVSVENAYRYDTATKSSNQTLRVVWKQSPNTNQLTTNYWIYRWTSLTQMNARSGDISNNLIAVVPHVPGAQFSSYLDNGPTSPQPSTDMGKTYWYTVRAGDAGACGQNLSAPGGPAFGVLRDRIGPAGGNGIIEISCVRPRVRHVQNKILPLPKQDTDPTNYHFYVHCDRVSSQFEWAEFYAYVAYYTPERQPNITLETNFLGRFFYMGNDSVGTWFQRLRQPYPPQQSFMSIQFQCRAAMFNGRISEWAIGNVQELPNERSYLDVTFEAFPERLRTFASRKDRDCYEHDPGGGGTGPGGTNDIGVHIFPTPGSKEYRIYRRIDDGPMSLLCQGAITNIASIISCFENAPPVNGGTVCFYFQLLDEHGNPSPMTFLGCVDSAPNTDLPVPTLTKLTPTGNESSPGMNVTWFCPPYGVERFELRIAGLPTAPDTNGFNLSPMLDFTDEAPSSMTFSNFGTNLTLLFYPFQTPKAGPGFGNNGAQFVLPANIQLGKTYIVTVRALGKNGNASEFSNFETFVWNPTNAPVAQVPWPARGAPPTNANFFTGGFFLSPTNGNSVLNASQYGNAVLIGGGNIGRKSVTVRDGPIRITEWIDPNKLLLTNQFGQSIFPCVMYRFQVPNANFPTVSGDVIQVSPLMETIAYEHGQIVGGPQQTLVHDPFVLGTVAGSQNEGVFLYLWLRDTQPQISGARYRYVLVRLKDNKEIDQLIQSNEVEVP
jgi:hypothetical protein